MVESEALSEPVERFGNPAADPDMSQRDTSFSPKPENLSSKAPTSLAETDNRLEVTTTGITQSRKYGIGITAKTLGQGFFQSQILPAS